MTAKPRTRAVASIKRATQKLGDNTALYFRSGMTFKIKSPIALPFSNVVIGAYGKGKTPRLVLQTGGDQYKAMFQMTGSSHQITIENLLIEGDGKDLNGQAIHADGSNIVVKGVNFRNLDSAIMPNGTTSGCWPTTTSPE
jgi:hypothetical protein